jgi:hypothetical protein
VLSTVGRDVVGDDHVGFVGPCREHCDGVWQGKSVMYMRGVYGFISSRAK